MTDDLVKRLRDEDSYYRWQEKHWCIDFDLLERLHLEAADRIEAKAAEIEFHKERADALALQADEWEGKYLIGIAEIDRLREAGKKLHDHATHDDDCRIVTHGSFYPTACTCGYSDAWKAWRAALGETE